MDLDLVFLSRLQFALTIMFHYLFPPLTIGLGYLMFALEAAFVWTKKPVYESAAKFWTKLFAVNFAMGVATGIVMEFQFGTNWATYSRYVGDVFGSALASEGIFAFFLESGFLAVVVFGWDRVGPKLHLFSTAMVALGGTFSAVWIVVANSWMQTPAGFHIVGHGATARAEITDFWAMVFNPSSVIRLTHTLIGCMVLGAFFVMSISAYYVLRQRHLEVAKRSFLFALCFGAFFSWAALVSGDGHAQQVARTQPAKLAAMEGHFHTGSGGAPLHLFGIPDAAQEEVRWPIAIPGGLSFLIHKDFNKPVPGLDTIPKPDRPPVLVPFVSFHLMVALGCFFIALSSLGLFFWWQGTLFEKPWLMWVFVWAVLGPYLANQAGWVTAEVGRQPWVVYGLLRTADGVSKSVHAHAVLASILMFGFIYFLLFLVWVYVMNDKIQHGPEPVVLGPTPHRPEGLLEAAGALLAGASLTEAHEGAPPDAPSTEATPEAPKAPPDAPPATEGEGR